MSRAQTGIDKAWFTRKMRESGHTARTMAPLLDMHFTVFSKMLNGRRHVRLGELRRIARILGEQESEVLKHLDREAIASLDDAATVPAVAKVKPMSSQSGVEAGPRSGSTRHDKDYIVPPKGADPLFGCMTGSLTLLPEIDYTAPADPDWGKVYDD